MPRKLSMESSYSSQGDASSAEDQEEWAQHQQQQPQQQQQFLTAPDVRPHPKVRRLSLDLPPVDSPPKLQVSSVGEESSSSVSTPGQSPRPQRRRHSLADTRLRKKAAPRNTFSGIIEPWSEPPSPKDPAAAMAGSSNSLYLNAGILQQTHSTESIDSSSNLIASRSPSFTELRTLEQCERERDQPSRGHSLEVSPCNSVHSAPIAAGECQTNFSIQEPGQGRSNAANHGKTKRGRVRNDEMRLTVTILIIILVFSATWLPVVIINFTEAFTNIKVHSTIARGTVFIVFFQNVLNPAIYGMMNRSFRDAIKMLLKIPRSPR